MVLAIEHMDLDAPSRLVLRAEDDASVFEVEYRLEAVRGGARLTQVSDLRWKRLRVLHTTFARGVRRDVRGQLRELKERLEDGVGGRSAEPARRARVTEPRAGLWLPWRGSEPRLG